MISLTHSLPAHAQLLSIGYSEHYQLWTVLLHAAMSTVDEAGSTLYNTLGSGRAPTLEAATTLALENLELEMEKEKERRAQLRAAPQTITTTVIIGDTMIDLDL